MAKDIELPKWSGRSILDESHGEELDRRAAAHEFDKKLPRHMAEQEAYREYQQEHHARAAAHHLMGMKSAQGAGSMDEARKHGAMYGMHLKELGEDIYGPVPSKVKHYVDAPDREKVTKFKAHKGDAFLLNDGEKDRESTNEMSKSEHDRLHDLYKAVNFLEKAWSFDSAKNGDKDYETKRCPKCKRDTIHKDKACKACKAPSEPESSAQAIQKEELEKRLGTATVAEEKRDGAFAKDEKKPGKKPQQLPLIPKERSMKPDPAPPGATCRGCGGHGRVPDFDASRTKHAKQFKQCTDCDGKNTLLPTKKSEEDDSERLHTLYKAIKMLELLKGQVVQGNFPQHKANPKAKGPAAPVSKIGPPSHSNTTYYDAPKQHPTTLVEGQWMHDIKPGSPDCAHRNPIWSSGGTVAACGACGGHFSTQPV